MLDWQCVYKYRGNSKKRLQNVSLLTDPIVEKATLGQTISQDKETGTKEPGTKEPGTKEPGTKETGTKETGTKGTDNPDGSDNSSGNPGIVIGIVFAILLVIFVTAVVFLLLRRYGGLFVSNKVAKRSGPKKRGNNFP